MAAAAGGKNAMSPVPESNAGSVFSPNVFYTVRETAELLKIGVKAVRGAIRRGELTAHRPTGNRQYRLLGAYVIAWIDRCEVRCEPTAAAPANVELVELRVGRRRATGSAEAPGRLPTSPNWKAA